MGQGSSATVDLYKSPGGTGRAVKRQNQQLGRGASYSHEDMLVEQGKLKAVYPEFEGGFLCPDGRPLEIAGSHCGSRHDSLVPFAPGIELGKFFKNIKAEYTAVVVRGILARVEQQLHIEINKAYDTTALVHCDLKPDNIKIDYNFDTGNFTLTIIDWDSAVQEGEKPQPDKVNSLYETCGLLSTGWSRDIKRPAQHSDDINVAKQIFVNFSKKLDDKHEHEKKRIHTKKRLASRQVT